MLAGRPRGARREGHRGSFTVRCQAVTIRHICLSHPFTSRLMSRLDSCSRPVTLRFMLGLADVRKFSLPIWHLFPRPPPPPPHAESLGVVTRRPHPCLVVRRAGLSTPAISTATPPSSTEATSRSTWSSFSTRTSTAATSATRAVSCIRIKKRYVRVDCLAEILYFNDPALCVGRCFTNAPAANATFATTRALSTRSVLRVVLFVYADVPV